MFKLFIVMLAMGAQPVPIGEVTHPYDFGSEAACEEFKAHDGWKIRTVDGYAFDAVCVKVSEGV